ncbi:cyclic pyranopterin monophosphate synthase MoaC [Oxyplasma meridianum]|uniref:Cyclic pyranopterin monophosphate synthase MoaC n=1 Tax=Oxyplasma meridianum TaxID=3073602 RepID=A0AAX4NF21_9ARCH
MIDIGEKEIVRRTATASGFIKLKRETLDAIKKGEVKKGDVLSTARSAGIMAAKHTPDTIPFCHIIALEHADSKFTIEEEGVKCTCVVSARYKTGVEMEALNCVSASLLTIWDMVKYMEKDSKGQYPHTQLSSIMVEMKEKTPLSGEE